MKLLAKKSNVLNQVSFKLKLFKANNRLKQKLTQINEISNDLCQVIDTSNILYESKLYYAQRPLLKEIIEQINSQFVNLNADATIYNQCLQMYYFKDTDHIDIDIDNDNQSKESKELITRLQKILNRENKGNELDQEDRQFLKMMINEYEIRYFINKSESEKEFLQALQMIEAHLLQQLYYQNTIHKKSITLKREDISSFEVPPDFYMGNMSMMNTSTNAIKLDLSSSVQLFLLKNCMSPQLRLQLFNDFLDVNKSKEQIMIQLMEARDQFASKLGFQDYQEYALSLNSKFFQPNRNAYSQQFLLQNVLSQRYFNDASVNQGYNSKDSNLPTDIRITIQRILNTSVERCHQKLDALFSDHEFYTSLLEKSHYKNIATQQIQLQYSDLLYLRQKILATPLYKFTLKWHQVFTLLNQITQRYFNVEFRERQSPNNHFYNRVSGIDHDNFIHKKETNSTDAFKKDVSTSTQKEQEVKEKNIKCYEVFQKSEGQEKIKGVVFIDFNAYEDAKTCFSSGYCEIKNFKQLPCLLIRMNFKVLDDSTEVTFDNFQTFMHEIGHSLHSLLNRHRYQMLANNYKIDYAEICAKIFENLIFLLPFKKSSSSSQLQENSVDFIFQKPFQQYIELFRIMSQLETVYYAKLDLFLHEKHHENSRSLKEFSSLIQKNIFKSLIPNNDNYWFCNLSHLEEYSGLYFSYAVGEEVFYEMQDKQDSLTEQQQFLQKLFTSAHIQ